MAVALMYSKALELYAVAKSKECHHFKKYNLGTRVASSHNQGTYWQLMASVA